MFYEEKELNEKDLVEVESSDGSYEEDDYHED